MERRCEYRNCGCNIPETTRRDAKYCNIKCRDNERTYIKRENRKLKKEKELIVKDLIQIEMDGDFINLFNKIYGN
jgi:hypothetical protein